MYLDGNNMDSIAVFGITSLTNLSKEVSKEHSAFA